MPLIICFFLWVLGHSVYRGWRRRKQQELVTTLSDSASVAFANSDGIPPPISELPTDNSPVMPSDNFHAIPRPISVLPSAPPIEVLTCHRCGHQECDIYPSQLVCPCCGNMWPLNVYAV
ncbi:hypothetical protein D8674_030093 [Pyrus ussuriensis x Pyrus communis]|uniref:Uncharacterized protein n=1 Tax=Pyrus ussuriensis x Pyrus communis TaxID=2448454 RepID=A0A5N5EVT4_9ROSA|nr:hypothetical protein D8674_030093 [Pyrus ussuriensis x Pyrus communis]